MQYFKALMSQWQGKSKTYLRWLYQDRYSPNYAEAEKVFSYGSFRFWFGGTSYTNSEKLLLFVEIPAESLLYNALEDTVPYECYLLKALSPMLTELAEEYQNIAKNVREKAQFEVQEVNEHMLRRSGILYNAERKAFILRIKFCVPLVNALSINAKAAIRAIHDILKGIKEQMDRIDKAVLNSYVITYRRQQEIRRYMSENELCAFIANGSILPRMGDTSDPMKDAVPFVSPDELTVSVCLSDGSTVTGMGIRKGITVITGGGYSGKSTLLDAIEMGIYNHIPGDGREYVLTDKSALKIYAEDGRYVSDLNMAPFFRYLPGKTALECFSAFHASGSVSQAANIIEAVYARSRLLLIDEDKSATNFMIRDKNMRMVVKNEPIIPYTDRIKELSDQKGISTILVIGGSSEYLSYADRVILMEDYCPRVITAQVSALDLPKTRTEIRSAEWTVSRRLIPLKSAHPFLFFRSVETENEKKIILDGYCADITLLTAVVSQNQLNSLAIFMEALMAGKCANDAELYEKADLLVQKLLDEEDIAASSLLPEAKWRYYEAVRPIDIVCCINRMRGLRFMMHAEPASENAFD